MKTQLEMPIPIVQPGSAEFPDFIRALPVLVMFPHNQCNCRCVMCDIWKIRKAREMSAHDLEPHLESFRKLGVKWIVFSGGEPLMHSDLETLARMCRAEGVRLTLLTTGLVLKENARTVASSMDDVIVSLDGPAEIHDKVRRVRGAYGQMANGIQALRALRPDIPVSGRCTVQKANFRQLRATVRSARELGLSSHSFLAVDADSDAFNRPGGWAERRQGTVTLDAHEVEDLETEITLLIRDCGEEIESGFIRENPGKLRRIVRHFRAHLGQIPAVSPRCNAPWVSAVVESDGTVRPCFFHRPVGNLRDGPLDQVLNSEAALEFRRTLDIARHPVCRRCVCSLFLHSEEEGGGGSGAAVDPEDV